MNQTLSGVFPIAPATFEQDGSYSYEAYQVAADTIVRGADGITLFGIAGEYYKLSGEEERSLLERTISIGHDAGKPVIVSNTKHSTEVAVQWAKRIESAGADCMMILPPFFLKPGPAQILSHMREVASAVSIPVMIQYAPEQTGVPLAPDVLVELYRAVPNALYYKIESKPPGHFVSRLQDLTHGEVTIFVGNAGFQLIEGLDRGAQGVMPGPSLFDIYGTIIRLYRSRKRSLSIRLHKELVYFLNHIRQSVEMIIISEKIVLKQRGITGVPGVRRPGYELDDVDTCLLDELYATLEREHQQILQEAVG